MKKLLLFLPIFLFAQLEFYSLSDTIANIPADSFVGFKFYLRNTSSLTHIYEIKALAYSAPNNWSGILCVKNRCVEIPVPLYDTLRANEMDTTIHLTIYPNNQSGQGIYCLKVKSLNDTTIRDSQFVYIFTTGIKEDNSLVIKKAQREKKFISVIGSLIFLPKRKGIYFQNGKIVLY
jgi:hypothetical protein